MTSIKIAELQLDSEIDNLEELSENESKKIVGGLSEVEQLRQRLMDIGIDVEAIEQFVRDLFGGN